MRLPRTIASSIDQVARSAIGKDWGLYAALIDHWSEIVGADYAKHTSPVKIVFPRGKQSGEKWAGGQKTGGTLTVKLPHGLCMAFTHQTSIIISRINGFFGYPAIERIALAPAYSTDERPASPAPVFLSETEKASVTTSVCDIENKELQDALAALGTSVLANQKRV